jgi:hypothetical protein
LNATLTAYIRAQLLACVLVGSLCGLVFAALGIPYSVLLGVLAGVLEFIPLVGPLLLAITASIVAALHAPILALWAVAFLGVLRMVEDYIVYPRLIRRGILLHPLAIIVAVLAGAELDGVPVHYVAAPDKLRSATLFQLDAIRLAKQVRTLSPDIAHAHGTEDAFALAAQRSGLPNVLTAQGLHFQLNRKVKTPILSRARAVQFTEWLAFSRHDATPGSCDRP